MASPVFEIVRTKMGAVSIRNCLVNEIMHNPVGPWAEANALYIDQSGLRDRLATPSTEPLEVFDVGLGAAANALATLACLETAQRPLHLISFEKDLELLRFALAHSEHFDHFRGFEGPIDELLERSIWKNEKVTWELRHGEFLDLIDQEPTRVHVVFYDPYSPKMNQEMWTTECFRKLYSRSRGPSEGGTSLFTYTRATPVRAALIAAGFFVGRGLATGLKPETTVASTNFRDLKEPLGEDWRTRWRRSHVRYPLGCSDTDAPAIDALIENYFLSPEFHK